jgi:hypothetical protein
VLKAANQRGLRPVHVAASHRVSLDVVYLLLRTWPLVVLSGEPSRLEQAWKMMERARSIGAP